MVPFGGTLDLSIVSLRSLSQYPVAPADLTFHQNRILRTWHTSGTVAKKSVCTPLSWCLNRLFRICVSFSDLLHQEGHWLGECTFKLWGDDEALCWIPFYLWLLKECQVLIGHGCIPANHFSALDLQGDSLSHKHTYALPAEHSFCCCMKLSRVSAWFSPTSLFYPFGCFSFYNFFFQFI